MMPVAFYKVDVFTRERSWVENQHRISSSQDPAVSLSRENKLDGNIVPQRALELQVIVYLL